jgi:hypothetical protein
MIDPMRFATLLLCMFGLSGCNARPAKYQVEGTITLNGKPLDGGEIFFIAADNSSSEAAKIKEGRYQVKTTAGRYKVMVNASTKKPNLNPPGMRGDDFYFESIIPDKYNERTSLTAEVAPQELNRCDFSLSSK